MVTRIGMQLTSASIALIALVLPHAQQSEWIGPVSISVIQGNAVTGSRLLMQLERGR